MPKITLIFFQFISFSLGFSALVVSIYQYIKYKEKSLHYYILFLILFTIRIVLNNILFLLRSSSDILSPVLLKSLLLFYQITTDLTFLMILALPVLFHSLLSVHFKKTANIIFYILIILCIALNFYPYMFGIFGGLSNYPVKLITDVESLMMVFIFIYLGIILFLYYPKTTEKQKKRTLFVIFISFLTFTLYDYFIAKNTYIFNFTDVYLPLWFNIGFYSFWNLFFLIFTGYNHQMVLLAADVIELNPSFLERFGISGREKEVIGMVLSGKTNQDIADKLFISLKTVKNHIHNIFQKTGAKTRMELSFIIRDFSKMNPKSHCHSLILRVEYYIIIKRKYFFGVSQ